MSQRSVADEEALVYNTRLTFGRNYIIAKPFDKRLIVEVSSAVAEAAIESRMSDMKDMKYFNLQAYKKELGIRI